MTDQGRRRVRDLDRLLFLMIIILSMNECRSYAASRKIIYPQLPEIDKTPTERFLMKKLISCIILCLVVGFCLSKTVNAAAFLADDQLDRVSAGVILFMDGIPAMLCFGCTTTATATSVTVVRNP